jgi:hypothetical protein
MAEKPDKRTRKGGKPKEAEKSVLGSLPSTRPERIGGARGTRVPGSRPTAARRKAAAPRTFEPTEAAEAAARNADAEAAGVRTPPVEAPPPSGPRAVRAGAPGIAPADGRERAPAPGGASLVGHVARAATGVARLGMSAGIGVLKQVVRRLPRL